MPSPAISTPHFQLPVRIYWEDTDAGGVVYHAQYLAFMERARSEWMRTHGYGQYTLRLTHGIVFAVRAMQIDFLKPARLDDALAVSVELIECRRASAVFHQQVARDGERLLAATVKVASLDAATFRPAAIPPALHQHLLALQSRPESRDDLATGQVQ